MPGRDAAVSLREVHAENLFPVLRLKVRPDQEQFVANNAVSIAEAHFSPVAWFRAIYADETPVGFVMIVDDAANEEYFLWRYLIDGRYQGLGFGRKALLQVIDYVRTRPGARQFGLSYVPGEGSPEGFYAGLGFVNTGKVIDDEAEMVLDLTQVTSSTSPSKSAS